MTDGSGSRGEQHVREAECRRAGASLGGSQTSGADRQRVMFVGRARASREKSKLNIFAAGMPVLLEVLQGGPHMLKTTYKENNGL